MALDVRIDHDFVHFRYTGSIYVQEATVIRETLKQYIDKGNKNFVINMSQVDYIDSSGLGVLVAVQKRAVQNGGKVIIKGLKGKVKELFELTRLTRVFEIQED